MKAIRKWKMVKKKFTKIKGHTCHIFRPLLFVSKRSTSYYKKTVFWIIHCMKNLAGYTVVLSGASGATKVLLRRQPTFLLSYYYDKVSCNL